MGWGLFPLSIFTITSALFSIFLLYVIFKYTRKSIINFRQLSDKTLGYSFLVLLGFYALLYVLFFPGFMGGDDVNMTNTILIGRAWDWQSFSYSLLSAAGLMLFGQFGFLPLLAISYYLYLSLKMLTLLDLLKVKTLYKRAVAVLFILLSVHPHIQGLLLTYSRDVLYSLMLTHLSLMMFAKNNWSTKDLAWLSGFLVFFADLRQESLIYLVIVPLILGCSKILNLRQLKIYSAFILVATFLYFYVAPKVYETRSFNPTYQVTAYVHPLSHALHKNGQQAYSPQDIAAIDRVFSVKKLIERYTPLDIGPFHDGGFNQNSTPEEWKQFKVAAHNIILQSKTDVLKGRVVLFMCALNICLEDGVQPFFDNFRDASNQIVPSLKLMSKTVEDYKLNESLTRYYNGIRDFYFFSGAWRALNTLTLPLLFILAGLLLFNRAPHYFRACVVVGARLPVLFFLAPASYYKYVFSVHLFFTIFFPLVLLTYLGSKQKSDGTFTK